MICWRMYSEIARASHGLWPMLLTVFSMIPVRSGLLEIEPDQQSYECKHPQIHQRIKKRGHRLYLFVFQGFQQAEQQQQNNKYEGTGAHGDNIANGPHAA